MCKCVGSRGSVTKVPELWSVKAAVQVMKGTGGPMGMRWSWLGVFEESACGRTWIFKREGASVSEITSVVWDDSWECFLELQLDEEDVLQQKEKPTRRRNRAQGKSRGSQVKNFQSLLPVQPHRTH